MDYQYINTIKHERYIDLPAKKPFPGAMLPEVQKYCCDNTFLADGINASVMFFTLTSAETAPFTVISRSDKKINSVSRGRFVQAYGWAWPQGGGQADMPKLFSNTDELLHTRFLTENEVDALAASPDAPWKVNISDIPAASVQIAPKALSAALFGVARRWASGEDAVRIAVPAGVDYMDYVMDAVSQLYAHMPFAMRAAAGFCSYLPQALGRELPRISIGFIPERMADSNTLFLDGSSTAYCNQLNRGTGIPDLNFFINELCTMDSDERCSLFNELYASVEGNGDYGKLLSLRPHQYSRYGAELRVLKLEGSAQELIPEWLKFLASEQNYSELVRNHVHLRISKLEEEDIIGYLTERGIKTLSLEESLKLVAICAKLCEYNEACASGVRKLLDAAIAASPLSVSEKYELLSGQTQLLGELINRDTLCKLYLEIVSSEFKSIEALPANLPKEYLKKADAANAFIAKLEQASFNSACGELLESARELAAQWRDDASSANLQYDELMQNLRSEKNYFGCLELWRSKRDVLERLDEEQRKNLRSYIAERRPKNYAQYCIAFTNRYEKPFSLEGIASVSSEPEDLSSFILHDISALLKGTRIHLDDAIRAGCRAQQLYNKIVEQEKYAQMLNIKLSVFYKGIEYPADYLKKMLSFSFHDIPENEKKSFSNVFFSLVSDRVFSGSDLQAICEQFVRCKFRYASLMRHILQGSFIDCSEDEYRRAFRTIYKNIEYIGIENIADVEDKLATLSDCDETAFSVYESFKKKNSKKERKKEPEGGSGKRSVMNIVYPVIIALLVVSLALLILLPRLHADKDTADVPASPEVSAVPTTPSPTPKPVESTETPVDEQQPSASPEPTQPPQETEQPEPTPTASPAPTHSTKPDKP